MRNCYVQLNELRIAKIRIETLENKKKILLAKVTSCTSQPKETVVDSGFSNDKIDKYLIKIEEIDEEIDLLKEEIATLEKGLEDMKKVLNDTKEIETQVFKLFYFEGYKPTQIASLIPCDLSTVYRKIKKINKKYETCQKKQKLS